MGEAIEPEEAEPLPGMCGLCGASVVDGTGVHAIVPDSSAIHVHDPALDGNRSLTACSTAHLGELQQHYHARPFVNAELWAGKIARALRRHPEGLSRERLVAETGLNLLQIDAAAKWTNHHPRHHHHHRRTPHNDTPEAP